MGIRRVITVPAVAATLAFTALLGSSTGAEGTARTWFTSWAESQQGPARVTLHHQSLRMVTHLSQGGDAIRVRLQNTFGPGPVTVDEVTAGLSAGRAAVLEPRPVTFGGSAAVTVPAGGDVWSDDTPLTTAPDQDVTISMYVAGRAVPGQHSAALRDNYLTPPGSGSHVADPRGTAYTRKVTATYLVSAVDVHNPALKGTVAAFGSSVVDGIGSTNCGHGCTRPGADRRWTDDLARRLVAELPRDEQLAVANAGIGGTTSAASCPKLPRWARGLDAMSRLDRDVLALHGVTAVIFYDGTNDLGYGCRATPVLTSYRQAFQRLHDVGIKVYVVPSTPRRSYTAQNNRDRRTIGLFVRRGHNCSGTCDGVVDFTRVLADPVAPDRINPAFDNGDGLHANMAGQQALARVIDLRMLAGR
ncbi:GDSL-type esterase/lipase family protein [Amycolatopsis sp. PS_44_ISF1]|uniref:GDSL-type esterase/lipase family protein n=1 Tax=Amycolatopsis sp. PS_44_ISF1 TaxID=2974917 RepID=UPI0028E03D73|nr:GDSL-type esterase/lipase family protein [Amycolatopsis sp. PS_44_ISF1]MDT8913337.1 GDSL-type esterase/lipase family protein [Amycolatopsis sp. PS_44_ISF1]